MAAEEEEKNKAVVSRENGEIDEIEREAGMEDEILEEDEYAGEEWCDGAEIPNWYLPIHLSETIPKECFALASIIPLLLGRRDPPPSAYLLHRDLHGGNILVDRKDGRPTTLLDFEMIYTIPRLYNFYSDKNSKDSGLPKVLRWITSSHNWKKEVCASEG